MIISRGGDADEDVEKLKEWKHEILFSWIKDNSS